MAKTRLLRTAAALLLACAYLWLYLAVYRPLWAEWHEALEWRKRQQQYTCTSDDQSYECRMRRVPRTKL